MTKIIIKTIQEIIDKVSYKPNVRFALSFGSDGIITIKITRPVEDATKIPDRPSVIVMSHRVEYGPQTALCCFSLDNLIKITKEQLISVVKYELFEGIRNMELHEMDEWLRYEGKYVNDPHPELKREKIKTS